MVSKMLQWLAERRKAIIAFVGAFLTALAVVVTGNESLADVTMAEWIVIAVAVLTTPVVVERVPNKVQKAELGVVVVDDGTPAPDATP